MVRAVRRRPRLVSKAVVRALRRSLAPTERQFMFVLTVVTGLVCGLVAVAFHLTIEAAGRLLFDQAWQVNGVAGVLALLLVPAVGGALAGAVLTWVPGARGSGIPQVKNAFAHANGRVSLRDGVAKFALCSMQIGTGASLGREGPTVFICASVTSALARAARVGPRAARRLTPVGVAAGIAAAFNAPIAAVTFTIEELVGTLDQTVLSGVVIAAALAAVIERSVLGTHPIIDLPRTYALDHASSLPLYALLGVAAGFVSVLFADSLLALRLYMTRVRRLPRWLHPALGGLVAGAMSLLAWWSIHERGVQGGGYETLGRALTGQLPVRALLVLCAVKVLATVFSYSTGGVGGIFAPTLFVGAMLGGVFGALDGALLDHEASTVGCFALVGMGAVFAGVIRAPITSVLILFEMTGGYGLVLPLMLANTTAYVLARHHRPLPIYEALMAQDELQLRAE